MSIGSSEGFGRVTFFMEANRKSLKLFRLVKWQKNMMVHPVCFVAVLANLKRINSLAKLPQKDHFHEMITRQL